MTPTQKKIALLSIKYMPTVLALTCSLKIWLNVMSEAQKDVWLFANNWVNIFLNMLFLAATFWLGKCFGFCWKHRSLCRIALWGYIYYAFFIVFHVPKDAIIPISALYVFATIVFTLLYKEVK